MSVAIRLSSGTATALVCFVIRFLAACASEEAENGCVIAVSVSCVLYEAAACCSITHEINEKHQREGNVSWPGSPVKVNVVPFKAATNYASSTEDNVGLIVSWLSPDSSARFVKGYKLKVVSANCDGKLCACRFFELTRQQSSEEQQSAFVYNLTLPALTNVSKWTVDVQSIPSTPQWPWSTSTAFLNIYDTFLDSTPLATKPREWGTPFVTVVTSATAKPNVAVMFALAPASLGLTSYVVKLWRCTSSGTEYCGQSLGRTSLQQPDNTATFDSVSAGIYQVSVEAENVGAVCGSYLPCKIRRSQLIEVEVPPKTSQPPALLEVQTTGQRSRMSPALISVVPVLSSGSDVPRASIATSRRSAEDSVSMLSTTTASGSNFRVAAQEKEKSFSGRWTITTYLYVTGAVLASVLLVGSVATCYLSRRGRRKGSYRTGLAPSQALSLPRATVFLVSHTENRHQRDATDALALYLEAHCSCTVIYYGWHLGDLQIVGPEHWVSQQVQTAQWVVFVHTLDSEHQLWKWMTASTRLQENDLAGRMLARVFDEVLQIPEKCLSVSFLSCANPVALFWLAGSSVKISECADQTSATLLNNERVFSAPSGLENADSQSSSQGGDSAVNEEHIVPEVEEREFVEETKCHPRVYRLMNDFSLLLADIHKLSPSATALKSRCLPTDANHLSTAEGRSLYKSVAVLRSHLSAACGKLGTAGSRPTGGVEGNMADLERLDSGFDDDCNVSFIPPDELSPDALEMTSLSDMLHRVNARSQWNEAAREQASDCHSLGWRDV